MNGREVGVTGGVTGDDHRVWMWVVDGGMWCLPGPGQRPYIRETMHSALNL